MNILLKNNNERKRSRCDINTPKAVQIPVKIYQKYLIYLNQKTCKLEFADHLYLPFIDQPQSDILFIGIMNFHIYNILVTKWKHGIGTNDIVTFNT